MNTVKFRKDRKHKSRDKHGIVGGLLSTAASFVASLYRDDGCAR